MTSDIRLTPQLKDVRVNDCMHHGILSCTADAPFAEVAALMASHRVHMVAVTNDHSARPIGIVSDLDVMTAALSADEPTARQVAATEPLTVSADASLERAAQLMTEHGISHLVVLASSSGYPIGVLSTLDIAAVCAA